MSTSKRSDAAVRRALSAAWNPAAVRRLGRAFADLAAAELTCSERGAVRAPDFPRRTQQLLAMAEGGGRTLPRARRLAAASLHLSHPCFMAQQITAPVPLAALAEALVAALNQSIAVWDMSPAGTPVDRELMRRFKKMLGFPAEAEGTLVPGGSYANLTALLAARAALLPGAWKSGGGRMGLLTGEQTHYSIARAAGIMGLGAASVFPIATTSGYRTDPAGVAAVAGRARRAGFRKLVVIGTCGSTPTGSCDDLRALGREAKALGAWFHVDAAHGGGFAFHRRLRAKLAGLEAADSVAFDPHKMMFMPLAAGAVLVRRGADLRAAFEHDAPYLFSPVARACPDVGHVTIACSQRFDALKIWLVWEAYGAAFFGAMAGAVCETTQAAFAYCAQSPILEAVHAPETNIFCFRLRAAAAGGEAADRLHWEIKEAVNASGEAYISTTVLEGRRVLRLVVMNPRSRPAHARRVLRTVEHHARQRGGRSR